MTLQQLRDQVASSEAFCLSDVENVCPAVYAPIYQEPQP